MTLYKQAIYPLLHRFDAEDTHEQTLAGLAWAQQAKVGRAGLRFLAGSIPTQPVQAFGLTFPNVLGMAAGFDKDVRVAEGLALLGFGHVEVGTLTPRPQVGNPRPRIFRLKPDKALINRMGFPNGGVETAVPRLRTLNKQNFILGVSLGKQKETPLAEAVQDYLTVMRAVYPYADYLAVNISSPNTPGLRELQGGDYLGHLLGTLQQESAQLAQAEGISQRPLLVKIAPDLTTDELDGILDVTLAQGISGIIATNTTLSREGAHHRHAHEKGGLSGAPLRQRSTAIIRHIHQQTSGQLPIVGIGGVQTAVDVQQKLDAGATLVQLYTGLVYEGPRMVGRILRGLNHG